LPEPLLFSLLTQLINSLFRPLLPHLNEIVGFLASLR
jgi:hypothetical protein